MCRMCRMSNVECQTNLTLVQQPVDKQIRRHSAGQWRAACVRHDNASFPVQHWLRQKTVVPKCKRIMLVADVTWPEYNVQCFQSFQLLSSLFQMKQWQWHRPRQFYSKGGYRMTRGLGSGEISLEAICRCQIVFYAVWSCKSLIKSNSYILVLHLCLGLRINVVIVL